MMCSHRIILSVILFFLPPAAIGLAERESDQEGRGLRPNNPVSIGGDRRGDSEPRAVEPERDDERHRSGESLDAIESEPASTSGVRESVEGPGEESMPLGPAGQSGRAESDAPLGPPQPSALTDNIFTRSGESTSTGATLAGPEGKALEASDRPKPGGWLPFDPGDIGQVFIALGLVIGLLFFLRMLMLRSQRLMGGAGRPSGVLEILARYPVGKGQTLVLLKLARRIILVHQHGQSMQTLTEVSDPDEVASLLGRVEAGAGERDAPRFRNLLRQFRQEHEVADTGNSQGREPVWPRVNVAGDEGVEVVDLTRRPSVLRRMLGHSGGTV